MTLADFERYAGIATLVVIPAAAILADVLLSGALRYLAYAETTKDTTDDARARKLVATARSFADGAHWLGENVGRFIPLVRRFVVAPKDLNPTPHLEAVEAETTSPEQPSGRNSR